MEERKLSKKEVPKAHTAPPSAQKTNVFKRKAKFQIFKNQNKRMKLGPETINSSQETGNSIQSANAFSVKSSSKS